MGECWEGCREGEKEEILRDKSSVFHLIRCRSHMPDIFISNRSPLIDRIMAKSHNWSPNTWDGEQGARYQVCFICRFYSKIFRSCPFFCFLVPFIFCPAADHTHTYELTPPCTHLHPPHTGRSFRSPLGPGAVLFHRRPYRLRLVREEAALPHLQGRSRRVDRDCRCDFGLADRHYVRARLGF